ncbi:MAG: translocation/assembly module TamB domain-containing protein, partial [Roseimicrobium sp.]
VELVRGRIFKEVEFLPLSLPNQLPPPPPAVRARKAGPPAAPGRLKDWTFDVAVTTRDPIRLLGNVLNGSVLVNAHVGGTGAATAIEGKGSLDGAKLMLPFSRLTITRGELVFTKEDPLDPDIDVQGDSLINNYQVTVYAYGKARAPKLRFTSSPPLPENEIASLLATGSTAGDPGGAEGMAANRAAYLLVSQAYRKLFNKAAPKRRLDEEPSKITFSVDPLGSGGSRGGGGTGPGVTARYEINEKLQATGSVGGEGFRGLLYYLVRLR